MYYMPARRFSWDRFNEMFEEFDRLFEPFARQTDGPKLNVWNDENGAELEVRVPGAGPDDIELNVQDRTLSIAINKEAREPADGESFLLREREFGEFSRTLTMPFKIDPKSVKARSRNGILSISVQRDDADKPRNISVSDE